MAQRIRLTASVGRQRLTKATPANQAGYVSSIRSAFKRITDNYEKVIGELQGASIDILYDALQPTFELSQKYCPKDTGKLVESGFLEKAGTKNQPRVVMGYAKGGDPFYAVFVHELSHLHHAAPTRSKFLLTALEQDAKNIQRRIVQSYKTMLGTA